MIWRVLIFWWLGLGLARGDYAPRSIADTFRAGNLLNRTNNALVQTFTVNPLNQLSNVTRTGTLTVSGALPVPSSGVTVNGAAAQTNGDFTFASTNNTLSNGTNTFTIVAENVYGVSVTNELSVNLPATVNYQYDANGNLISDGTRSFVYDAENRLTNVSVSNQWQTGFAYDGLGRRRIVTNYIWQSGWVITNIAFYIYDGMLVLQERNSNNIPIVTYTRGLDLSDSLEGAGGIGGLLARTDTNSTTYYHADGGGNITAMIDGTQVMVARYEYDPFGRLIGQWGTNAAANVYRFSSKEYDSLTGLYYYGARFYDPTLQRWLNRDPIQELGGINMYQICGNNPFFYIDPYGRFLSASSMAETAAQWASEAAAAAEAAGGAAAAGTVATATAGAAAAALGALAVSGIANAGPTPATYPDQNDLSNPFPNNPIPSTATSPPLPNPASISPPNKPPCPPKKAPPGFPGDEPENHHRLPQQFANWFSQQGVDPEDYTQDMPMQWHRGEDIGIHSQGYNDAWNDFMQQNPNATAQEIIQQMYDLENQFGFGTGY